jgi:uncharacterized membrane protein YheB (UPF0754 family)
MIEQKLYLLPIIGLIIGAFTNYLAIKMLFHPRKPILGIQGLLPKRRQMLAEKISDAATRILPDSVRKLENIPILGPTIISEFKKTVEAQVNNLSLKELEDIIMHVMHKELNFVIWIGGAIGFLIGLLQILIVIY